MSKYDKIIVMPKAKFESAYYTITLALLHCKSDKLNESETE